MLGSWRHWCGRTHNCGRTGKSIWLSPTTDHRIEEYSRWKYQDATPKAWFDRGYCFIPRTLARDKRRKNKRSVPCSKASQMDSSSFQRNLGRNLISTSIDPRTFILDNIIFVQLNTLEQVLHIKMRLLCERGMLLGVYNSEKKNWEETITA